MEREETVFEKWDRTDPAGQRSEMIRFLTGKVATAALLNELKTDELLAACQRLGELIGSVHDAVYQHLMHEGTRELEERIGEKYLALGDLGEHTLAPISAAVQEMSKPLTAEIQRLRAAA
jgi:hypothetical protein